MAVYKYSDFVDGLVYLLHRFSRLLYFGEDREINKKVVIKHAQQAIFGRPGLSSTIQGNRPVLVWSC